jgi:hypothetical protein
MAAPYIDALNSLAYCTVTLTVAFSVMALEVAVTVMT